MTRIEELMKKLDLTEAEARQLIEDDKEIDRMKKFAEIESDMTEEQKAVAKKSRRADNAKKPTVYKFDKKSKKENPIKQQMIETVKTALVGMGADNVEILNAEREFTYTLDGVKYKIVLSAPRK